MLSSFCSYTAKTVWLSDCLLSELTMLKCFGNTGYEVWLKIVLTFQRKSADQLS